MKYVVYINTYHSENHKQIPKTTQQILHEITLCRNFIADLTTPDEQPEILEFAELHTNKKTLLQNRKYLLNAIACLEENDCFVVPDAETLGSDRCLPEVVETLVTKRKSKFICIDPGLINSDILNAIQMYESMFISQRTRRSVRARKLNNQHHSGRVPFSKRVGPGNVLIWDYEECALIKHMQELRKSGYSFQKIANTLNAQGRTNRGRPWQNATVFRMHTRDIPEKTDLF